MTIKSYFFICFMLFFIFSCQETTKNKEETKENINKKELKPEDYQTSIENALSVPEKVDILRLGQKNLKSFPAELAKCKNLKSLYLGYNPEIDYEKAFDVIVQFENLEELQLTGNHLKKLPKKITALKKLKALWIDANNKLNWEEVFTILKDLPNLQEIFVGDNDIKKLPDNIADLPALEILNLERNELLTLPKSLEKSLKLQSINLSGNLNIKLIDLFQTLSQYKNLQVLQISENAMSILPEEIIALQNLEILWINNNRLKSLPNSLTKLPKLKNLYIFNNDLDSVYVENFKKQLPKTEVVSKGGMK